MREQTIQRHTALELLRSSDRLYRSILDDLSIVYSAHKKAEALAFLGPRRVADEAFIPASVMSDTLVANEDVERAFTSLEIQAPARFEPVDDSMGADAEAVRLNLIELCSVLRAVRAAFAMYQEDAEGLYVDDDYLFLDSDVPLDEVFAPPHRVNAAVATLARRVSVVVSVLCVLVFVLGFLLQFV